MIVNDLNILSTGVGPAEAHAKLFVDSNAVLTDPVASQRFQPVAGRNPQITQLFSNLQLSKFTACHNRYIGKPFNRVTRSERARVGALECLDHRSYSNAWHY